MGPMPQVKQSTKSNYQKYKSFNFVISPKLIKTIKKIWEQPHCFLLLLTCCRIGIKPLALTLSPLHYYTLSWPPLELRISFLNSNQIDWSMNKIVCFYLLSSKTVEADSSLWKSLIKHEVHFHLHGFDRNFTHQGHRCELFSQSN